MGRKPLSKDEAQLVAKKASEIVKGARGDLIKEQALISKLYEVMPEFRDRPLWRAFSFGIDNGLLQYAKYKGYYYGPTVEEVIPSPGGVSLHPTPTKDDGKERYYYPFVANWFLRSGNCLAEFRKGKEWGMPDVSIVRGSSSELVDELELITIEVKRGWANISDLSQAYRYSKLAHRCYLAADVKDDLLKLREHAEKMGVGLLAINLENPSDIAELLSPPRSEPSAVTLHEHLATVFDLVTCCLCGVWFRRVWGSKKENIQGTTAIIRSRVTGGLDIWRYACPECEGVFRLAKRIEPLR